jgi:hypothetical protein
MTSLQIKDLEEISSLCGYELENYKYFVETGTYYGETTLRMQERFEKIFTIELSAYLYQVFASRGYDRSKITSLLGDSGEELTKVIPQLESDAIFFLDGHYSSDETAQGIKDVPLLEELEIIGSQMEHEAIIIIDDLRLFGTKMNEDWSYITKDALLKRIENRIKKSFEINDRFVILLSRKDSNDGVHQGTD